MSLSESYSTRNAEVVSQRRFWLARAVYICNTVHSYSQPQNFHSAWEKDCNSYWQQRLATSTFFSLQCIKVLVWWSCQEKKILQSSVHAHVSLRMYAVHAQMCTHRCVFVCVCVCVCVCETKSISSIQWGISSKHTACNYNRPCSHCLFSLSFICLPSASYGCSLH